MEVFKKIETATERGLFASRWIMAPFYIGLVGALVLLLISFLQQLYYYFSKIPNLSATETILAALTLIDLSLAGNLVLIVIFSGYENFVSKMDVSHSNDKFEWKGTFDFSSLKLKLVASIVAISGIHLLKIFMDVGKYSDRDIQWLLTVHVVFVVSGVLLALMDMIAAKTKTYKKG